MEAPEVSDRLEALKRQERSVQRYEGIVRVRGRDPEGSFDARLVVIFARPEDLRVELLGAFGATRWSAVAGREGIRVYFPGRREYVEEDDVTAVVGALLGLRMTASEVMAALAGVGVPLGEDVRATGYHRGDFPFLDLAGDVLTRLELDGSGQVVRAEGRGYRVSYPTDWKARGRTLPDALLLENDEIRVTLRAEEVDVNVRLDPEAFRLDVPADASRLRPAEIDGEAVFVVERKR
jgi:hypothetical protein